jgi:hypothetical protein
MLDCKVLSRHFARRKEGFESSVVEDIVLVKFNNNLQVEVKKGRKER